MYTESQKIIQFTLFDIFYGYNSDL